MSRIGKKPIIIPQGVEIKIDGQRVTANGPKGEISKDFRPELMIAMEDNKINTQCDEWVINYREREADSRALALYKISYALTDSMTTKDQLRLMADALDNMAECLTGKRDQSRYRRVTKGGLDCQAFTVTDKYALSDEDE